jgi:hypothetical protein
MGEDQLPEESVLELFSEYIRQYRFSIVDKATVNRPGFPGSSLCEDGRLEPPDGRDRPARTRPAARSERFEHAALVVPRDQPAWRASLGGSPLASCCSTWRASSVIAPPPSPQQPSRGVSHAHSSSEKLVPTPTRPDCSDRPGRPRARPRAALLVVVAPIRARRRPAGHSAGLRDWSRRLDTGDFSGAVWRCTRLPW